MTPALPPETIRITAVKQAPEAAGPQDVHSGTAVHLKFLAYPYRTYTGIVEQILPAAALDRPVAHPDKFAELWVE